jgi:POT family proton-dependent oligopeptide transporter
MKAILVIFMTKYLMDKDGNSAPMVEEEATTWFHLFNSAVYFTPLLGAIVADAFLGKYKTIISLSIVYCLGHLALALDETRLGLSVGLTLIAIGAGGIKPCVSAHVGDQFGKTNGHLLTKIFGWFYFSINLGAFASQIMTPIFLDRYGPHVAFGVPGGLMLLATVVFWMGRREFVHIPAGGVGFLKETFSKEGLKIIGRLCIIYLFVAMFWALFDQSGSKWVLQADRMDRNWLGIEWLPSQINAINPVMIMVFIPIFTWLIYPGLTKVFPLTPLRKIGIGFFVAVPSFLIPAWIETQINGGELPSIIWQLLAYIFLTAAEVFISITALEFSYTQAPKKMKSLILGFFLMSVSMGNLFTAGVNHFMKNDPPSFTPDVAGIYEVQLEASDGDSTEQAKVVIAVGPELPKPGIIDIIKAVFRKVKQALSTPGQTDKTPKTKKLPTANAGQFRAVPPSKLVRLYGTADKGDYNGKFSYKWSFISVPEGSKVNDSILVKADTRNPHFTPDVEGDYELQFIVNVGQNTKATATNSVTLQVTRENLPPVINVDEGAIGFVDSAVILDGTDTVDPNGDELTFSWSFVSKPEGSKLENKDFKGKKFPGPTNKLKGADYYLFFAGCMLVAALIFIPVARWYQPREYLQEEEDGEIEREQEA